MTPGARQALPRVLPTLRARMVRHVLLPVSLVWLLGSMVVLWVASQSASAVFDRGLLDDALGLAASVSQRDGRVQVDLSADALRALLFDQSESVHFAVRAADGALVAGQPALRAEDAVVTSQPAEGIAFADLPYQGEVLRAVRLQRSQPQPYTILLAQTTRERTAHLRRLVAYALAPLVALLLLLGAWLGRAIQRDLAPVEGLQRELDRRPATELQPITQPAGSQELERLVAAVNALMSRVDGLLAAQREFTGNVAHELRTPLAGIRALAEFGLARDEPALWREQLQAIVHSQQRASRLVDQLLALALADEARAGVHAVPVALDELVRRVLLAWLPRADAEGVDLGAQGLDEPVWVMGDEALIEGALQNLLDNALRYGRPPAGGAVRITVQVVRGPQGTCLVVLDNGPGVAQAQAPELLARWQQGADGRRLGQGAGLGLAIVSRYASLLGARFELGPGASGQGARAALCFAPQGLTPAEAGASRSPSGSGASPRP